ncbi:sensor histidine kinase [Antrihabitans cavernicola]|uniref:histidine kinase n=1 Tax=Antrihabitans cavernicola TaxID=2495913 RepID=A0A5A7S4T7_9NOCA|nr:HAMP domain-containing sensor histidine kinase [Spelaeibacter cavernicola]KAA0021188.1 HAMP domain-containing histidine kinase [Spelaeibacter cavernicola]
MKRSYSLRARVAAATALGATIIVVILGFLVAQAIERNNLREIDQRLETAAPLAVFDTGLAVNVLSTLGDSTPFALTVRTNGNVDASTPTELPAVAGGSHSVKVQGIPYRTYTIVDAKNPDKATTLALPAASAAEQTSKQQRQVVGAGVLAVAAAAGLGWLLGGRAVRPIVQLTRRISEPTPAPLTTVSGVREAEELGVAINVMLQRVADAQADTTAALTTARDFSAVSAHELRTPLTAMRTDIEVLRTVDLDAAQRAEILDDMQRTQGRVEATLTALERLASGELAAAKDHVPTDVVELCDLAANDARRHFPGLDVRVESDPTLVITGLPAGLRLAVDNALSNAFRHGAARNAVVSAHRDGKGRVTIAVDDDGSGIPADERSAVFERFYRGTTAARGGSGLGLALVAQQAQLHGGSARFEDSALGGVRLVIEFPAATLS